MGSMVTSNIMDSNRAAIFFFVWELLLICESVLHKMKLFQRKMQ